MPEFRVQRVLPMSVDEAWRAFTEPSRLEAWFWPPAWNTRVSVDLRVGGSFRIDAGSHDLAVGGDYLEVEAPGRLVHTWLFDGEAEPTLVTLTINDIQGEAGLTILHERFADAESAEQNRLGWESCLDRLAPAAS
jgi:uncharacterized protein YndB with AHSA1/START domain